MPTQLPNINWMPSPAFTEGRGGKQPDLIVIHVTEGGYLSSIDWLRRQPEPDKDVGSCHYVIDEQGKRLAQLVRDEDTAWHAGNWSYNQRAIGIEHSGFTKVGNFSDGLYRAGAALTARLCKRWGIPADRKHIIAHSEVPWPNNHTDPGKLWDWQKFMVYVAEEMAEPAPPTPVEPPAPSLPWGAKVEGEMIVINGKRVGHGFKEFFLTLGGALTAVPDLATAIDRGVYLFGLPTSEEYSPPNGEPGAVQDFERYRLRFDPRADGKWRVRGEHR